jgi:hypothetical protein
MSIPIPNEIFVLPADLRLRRAPDEEDEEDDDKEDEEDEEEAADDEGDGYSE